MPALLSGSWRDACGSPRRAQAGAGRCADSTQHALQDTTNSVWCFARLFHYPGAELLQAISLYCLRHWHRFKPQELANMIWALALLRACSPHTW